jgi:hypothetical protein
VHAPSAAEVLDLWDDCAGQSLARRGLRFLMAACPGMSADALAALTIGERDARLLALRQALWGPEMVAVATCPACRERIEMTLDARQFLARSGTPQTDVLSLRIAGYDVTFRLPTSLDLIALSERTDLADSRDVLLQLCRVSARDQKDLLAQDDPVPEEVIAGVAQAMADADPLADIQLAVNCLSCPHQWRVGFDVVSFLWAEIEAWALRILREVHTLASAYGWHERDILNLSSMRRRFYMESVSA